MPIQLEPPVGLPSPAHTADDEAWSTLVTNQLTDTRKSAENWRNGLVALIGLIATFTVVKGPSDLTGLGHWAAIGVGVLLLLALVCGVFGTWKSLTAAYGKPAAIARSEFLDLGGADGYHLQLAARSAADLRWAQRAMLISLALAVVAVGLTWYGPRGVSATLKVDRKSALSVCGRLVGSKNGDMEIKPPASQAVRVPFIEVTSINAVDQCP